MPTRQALPGQVRVRFGGVQTPRGFVFELTGGRLCLDFANTLDERGHVQPRDRLSRYADLIDWGLQAGAITGREGARLREAAARDAAGARKALRSATLVREGVFRVFSAIARRRPVPHDALALLNYTLPRALSRRCLRRSRGQFYWSFDTEAAIDLDRVLWAAASSAADLLTSRDLERVRQCDGAGCAWLFIDTSKNQTRRWCDMSVCGNRAKARRHQARKRRTPVVCVP